MGRIGKWPAMLAVTAVLGGFVRADVRLPSVIGDNMVLQQGTEVSIWGWAEPGSKVRIVGSWSEEEWETTASRDGRWEVKIKSPVLPATRKNNAGPYEMTISDGNSLTLKNILAGEVWVCSGQSNMEWPVSRSAGAEQEINEANWPQIRLFRVGRKVAYTPMKSCRGRWRVCDSHTAGRFSAVGYFFGRELHTKLSVPIGLIHTSWGGTPAEAWMSRECLESDADFEPILRRYEQTAAHYPELYKNYLSERKRHKELAARRSAEGKPAPAAPESLVGPNHPYSPAGLFNGMVLPIAPYGIRGVIWYQGESNAGRAEQYRELFPALITCWRQAWGRGDFPFLFVQLANWRQVEPEPGESDWAELREAQLMALSVPNTGMAVTIDIGDANDIHPKNKQEVGRRLALWALAKTYGKDVEYCGPLYQFMEVRGNEAVLHFEHTAGGLVAGGGLGAPGLKGFAIAGPDKKFVWADAKIEGDTVVVSSDEVSEPVAVRYGWANNPVCNLYNRAGLPASPFRTDDWPGVTAGRK